LPDFLCPLKANKYGIEFLQFAVTDYETKKTIFEVGKDVPGTAGMEMDFDARSNDENAYRKIKYTFSEDVLRLPLISTSLTFKNESPLPEFRMIERHYFRNQLVKSFDFIFGFCIPGSTNTWDTVYSLPPLEDDLIASMIDSPFDTRSDSFYFVGEELVMHNKASYKYFAEDQAQEKRSYDDVYEYKNSSITRNLAAKAEGKDDGGGDFDAGESESKGGVEDAGAKSVAGSKGEGVSWSKAEDYD
jgi:hypothetical protein